MTISQEDLEGQENKGYLKKNNQNYNLIKFKTLHLQKMMKDNKENLEDLENKDYLKEDNQKYKMNNRNKTQKIKNKNLKLKV